MTSAMATRVLTVGHSNHPIDLFLKLLYDHRVETIVDTRSLPRSSFAPQYDAQPLQRSLQRLGIGYLYLGKELGGRPEAPEFYDDGGHVLYSRVAESAVFRSGLDRLEQELQKSRLALLCAEENPSVCHRRLLIARVLTQRGVSVGHIRADGSMQTEEELLAAEAAADPQLSLFEHSRIPEWKSIPSVLPKRPRNDSSAS